MEDKTTKRSDKKDKKNVKPLHPPEICITNTEKMAFLRRKSQEEQKRSF